MYKMEKQYLELELQQIYLLNNNNSSFKNKK